MSNDNAIDQITLLDIRQVASAVGRSEWTVASWVRSGRFPAPIQCIAGGKRQWKISVVKAWIEQRSRRRYRPPTPRGALRRVRDD